MKNNLSIEDLVGRYLDNEMTEVERVDFESQLRSDPALKEELNFQKDLIHSIRESRRLELKSRLTDIQVPSTPIFHAVGIKIAAVASVTAIIGTGAYFLMNSNDDPGLSGVDLSQTTTTMTREEVQMPAIPEVSVPEVEAFEPGDGDVVEQPVKAKKKQDEPDKTATADAAKTMAKPHVVRPDIAEITEEKEPETEDFVEEKTYNDLDEINETMAGKLAVETEKSRRYRFHYKFYNEKLYLIGDFKDSPYEILELNARGSKRYFLFYEGVYYRLSPDKVKPTPLEKITDEALVDELRIIQQNK
jgi:hypothetical protein